MKKLAIALALAGGATIAPQAEAAVQLNDSCTAVLTVALPSSEASCIGWYSGNVLNSNNNTSINDALTQLGYSGQAISFANVPLANIFTPGSGTSIVNFGQQFNGTVYLGLHFGSSVSDVDARGNTAFFKINASDLGSIQINSGYTSGTSNVVVLTSTPTGAVPEPATWALMILGFAGIGFAMRRNKTQTVAVRYNFA
jgi:hypothetical protein